jgi:hypothetical protein
MVWGSGFRGVALPWLGISVIWDLGTGFSRMSDCPSLRCSTTGRAGRWLLHCRAVFTRTGRSLAKNMEEESKPVDAPRPAAWP